jgi:hypothetical protein
VALAGINLAAVRATMVFRAQRIELCAAAAGNLFQMADGRVLLQPGRKGTVYREIHPATTAGLCRTYWPVAVGAGLTVLASAALALRGHRRSQPRYPIALLMGLVAAAAAAFAFALLRSLSSTRTVFLLVTAWVACVGVLLFCPGLSQARAKIARDE